MGKGEAVARPSWPCDARAGCACHEQSSTGLPVGRQTCYLRDNRGPLRGFFSFLFSLLLFPFDSRRHPRREDRNVIQSLESPGSIEAIARRIIFVSDFSQAIFTLHKQFSRPAASLQYLLANFSSLFSSCEHRSDLAAVFRRGECTIVPAGCLRYIGSWSVTEHSAMGETLR